FSSSACGLLLSMWLNHNMLLLLLFFCCCLLEGNRSGLTLVLHITPTLPTRLPPPPLYHPLSPSLPRLSLLHKIYIPAHLWFSINPTPSKKKYQPTHPTTMKSPHHSSDSDTDSDSFV